MDELLIPPREIEIAELQLAITQELSQEAVLIFRRLAFHYSQAQNEARRLKQQLQWARDSNLALVQEVEKLRNDDKPVPETDRSASISVSGSQAEEAG